MKKMLMVILLTLFTLTMAGCGSGGSDDGSITPSTNTSTPSGTPTTPSGTPGTLEDLGDLVDGSGDNWYYTKAVSINNSEQIVGQSNAGSPVKAAFLWTPGANPGEGTISFIGIHVGYYDDYYGGAGSSPFIYSEAVDINDAGAIICNSTTGTGWPEETEKRAFYRTASGTLIDLAPVTLNLDGVTYSEGKFSEAVDINNNGEVVLTVEDETGSHAYYWDGDINNTVTTPLGVVANLQMLGRIVGADGEAVAINEYGQAVINSGGTAVFDDLDAGVVESLNHLPGQSSTTAVDINDAQPVGHIIGNSGDRGFFWDGGAMYPIDDLGGGTSEAVDFNNSDIVVGNSKTSSGATHAFRWYLDAGGQGHIVDLGTLGGTNSYAVAINESGQITGYSDTGDTYEEGGVTVGIYHAFLWSNGTMYDLGSHNDFYTFAFVPPYPFSEAAALNNNGAVAGNSVTINSHYRGFMAELEE